MKIAFYDTHSYDKTSFLEVNKNFGFEIDFFDFKLNEKTAAAAKGFDAVCIFVNDVADKKVSRASKAKLGKQGASPATRHAENFLNASASFNPRSCK